MTDAVTKCLPPDPSVSGLWWLSTPADPVMRAWHPASRAWADTDGGRTAACSAHAAGWRVLAAAVPPMGADHLSGDDLCDASPPMTAEQEAFMIVWAGQVRVRNAADLLRREGRQCVPRGDAA